MTRTARTLEPITGDAATDAAYALTRRRLLAGTVAAGLATTLGVGIAFAQDGSEATPTAGTDADATPAVGGQSEEDEDGSGDGTAAVERATAAILAAEGDRDAVSGQIDATTIDRALAQATTLRDRAETSVAADDTAAARRAAFAAIAIAHAAGNLVEAQLIAAGLPSQEAPASRVLANAHAVIQEVTTGTADATDAEVGTTVALAQELYQTAFDRFGEGQYGQAARTARAAMTLAGSAALLAAPDDAFADGPFWGDRGGDDFPGLPGIGRHGGRREIRREIRGGIRDRVLDRDPASDADAGEPVDVPEPEFSA